ncbi:hypothetical protein BN14_03237 [Rhizoctonia solani AG-1 IB]|jgi:hypothetical protein|uniref:Uncharacterized protein n=1 Tax=Thanatephorus cucumeris (strain AG1-IB / isolate 7/3/14) TaxID=1108050 RepID=M5BZZ1_THACB|nr:hypothetical protein BN14_03237 [Rhizoctonia solani AG-1 IB]
MEHLVADASEFDSPQVEHDHAPEVVGNLIPAAPQSNDAVLTGGAALSFFASQTVHFSVAVAGLDNEHVEQVHSPAVDAAGAFIPAAPQLKEAVLVTGAAPGLIASQTVHF